MNRHERELLDYEEEAEDRFDDYDYDDDMDDEFDTGFEGLEDDYDGYDDDYEEVEYLTEDDEDGYDDYSASSVGRIDPNDRTLTVIIKNTSGAAAEAVIFGANQNLPQSAGVTVDVAESSHQEVRNETFANPFKIVGMKMSVNDPLQFDNVLNITKRTATGLNSSSVFQPRNSTSPQNFSQQIIDASDFEMDVTPQHSISLLVNDGAVIVMTFTIKVRANMANLLKGKNVAEMSNVARTTGVPQIDMMQNKKPTALSIRKKPRRVRKVVRRKRPIVRGRRRSRPVLRRRRR